MKISLFPNTTKDLTLNYTNKLIHYLEKLGAEVVYPERDMAVRLGKKLLSGQLIGFVQNFNRTQETGADCVTEN